MTASLLLTALEPEAREAIFLALSSDELTELLGYSARRDDAARKLSHLEQRCGQIELTLTYDPFP
jgi:hypothetical protein